MWHLGHTFSSPGSFCSRTQAEEATWSWNPASGSARVTERLVPSTSACSGVTNITATHFFLAKMIHFVTLSIWVVVKTNGPLRRATGCPWAIVQSTTAYGGWAGPLDAIHMVKSGDKSRPLGEAFQSFVIRWGVTLKISCTTQRSQNLLWQNT